jgi:hypothetical protein
MTTPRIPAIIMRNLIDPSLIGIVLHLGP